MCSAFKRDESSWSDWPWLMPAAITPTDNLILLIRPLLQQCCRCSGHGHLLVTHKSAGATSCTLSDKDQGLCRYETQVRLTKTFSLNVCIMYQSKGGILNLWSLKQGEVKGSWHCPAATQQRTKVHQAESCCWKIPRPTDSIKVNVKVGIWASENMGLYTITNFGKVNKKQSGMVLRPSP